MVCSSSFPNRLLILFFIVFKESIHLLSAEIYILRLIAAEALMLCHEQIVVEHQEVRVLAGRDGTLARLDAKLLKAVVMQNKPSFPQNR